MLFIRDLQLGMRVDSFMEVQGVQGDVRARNGQEIDSFGGILNIISFRFRYHGGDPFGCKSSRLNEMRRIKVPSR